MPPDWALQDPEDYRDVLRQAVPAAIRIIWEPTGTETRESGLARTRAASPAARR